MKTIKKWAWKDSNMKQQKCSQFSGNGKGYKECQNPSAIERVGLSDGFAMDFCAMHNHMQKTGVPVKCWRCGDKER